MKHKFIINSLFSLLAFSLLLPLPLMSFAAEGIGTVGDVATVNDVSTEVTATDIGLSESQVNSAVEEETEVVSKTGTLIEIGNTTAENTTIIIRTTDEKGETEDQTVEVDTSTSLKDESYKKADLSDWIAGDQITYTADHYTNSGAIVANNLKNRSFKGYHKGKNGWITALRPDQNEMDVTWNSKVFTLNTSDARMVAGLKNPATLDDFEVDDRVRARVVEDGDGNSSTWDAKIVVVLRRGSDLFMRVTRWVVSAEIVKIPEDITLPTTIEVEVSPSKFFEEGDVNNLIGAPGTILSVDITEKTNLRRRYMGKAFLKEFSEGDSIRIIGRRDENTGYLAAKFIKNNSIQRLGVAHRLGRITEVDTSSRTIKVNLVRTARVTKSWTINVLDDAKILKAGQAISLSDIKVDDVVRVRGTANRHLKTVDAKKVIVVVKITTSNIVD